VATGLSDTEVALSGADVTLNETEVRLWDSVISGERGVVSSGERTFVISTERAFVFSAERAFVLSAERTFITDFVGTDGLSISGVFTFIWSVLRGVGAGGKSALTQFAPDIG
jgi:hypothetical protein